MDSLIKETNENLKTILDTMKDNLDNSASTLENIQLQMDKKVDEAKKYKVQVDVAKDKIRELEEENKSLELSLNELNDKYGKMNLVSIIEAGNREIKTKINDNVKEINKQKEHIAELTNRARTIKDLLLNLKKDKNIKEQRLENIKVAYSYYSERINEIIDYAFDHSENLADYRNSVSIVDYDESDEGNNDVKSLELENTMVFDEIANIDENKNFKDEMSFINDQIDNTLSEETEHNEEVNNIDEIIKRSLAEKQTVEIPVNEAEDEVVEVDDPIDTTQVFDSIINSDNSYVDEDEKSNFEESNNIKDTQELVIDDNILNEENLLEENTLISDEEIETNIENNEENPTIDTTLFKESESDETEEISGDENKFLDEENANRINKINDLFSSIDESDNNIFLDNMKPIDVNGVESKIDNAYMDIFGQPLNSEDLNKKESTLTDIFGNPIKNEDLSEDVKAVKKLEELFVENGIDFNKFREDEKSYLKEIYDEEKFTNIIDVLKKNKINLDNLYHAFNIFGEITPNELENLINKLLNSGQSFEAIGVILEKLPKVKKYNLDEVIMSYGDYVKDVDITELIMKAKELYKNGGNS